MAADVVVCDPVHRLQVINKYITVILNHRKEDSHVSGIISGLATPTF